MCKEKKDNDEQEGFSAPTKIRFQEGNKNVSSFDQNTKINESKNLPDVPDCVKKINWDAFSDTESNVTSFNKKDNPFI